MGRISNRFATLYVAGCLAVRFKIFPFTEAEVLEALLTCHRDHVAFIDEQLNIPAGSRPAIIRGPTATTTREPIVRCRRSRPDPLRPTAALHQSPPQAAASSTFVRPASADFASSLKLRAMRSKSAPVSSGTSADGDTGSPMLSFEEVAGGSDEATL